ncbi:MAG: hypothetical protein AAF984_03725 [Verrucomicrobiota bacterium]
MKYKSYLLVFSLFLLSAATLVVQNADVQDDSSSSRLNNSSHNLLPTTSYLITPPRAVRNTIHSVAQEYVSRIRNMLWIQAVIGDHDRQAAENLANKWEQGRFNANTLPTIYLLDPAVVFLEEDGQRVKDSDGYSYNAFDELYYDIDGNAVTHANLPDVQFQGAYQYGANIIYLSEDLFASGSDPLAARDVIIQELAHYLDFMLGINSTWEEYNGSEGILASMCFDDTYRFFYDDTIDASRNYTDHATLFWPLNGGVQVELGFKKKLKRLKHKLRQEARDAAQEINHAGNALVRLGSEVLDVYEDAILEEYGEAAHLFDEAKDFYEAHSQAIQMAGMIAMLILSGPELVASFGVGTPAVLAEDAMLLGAMEALTEAPEGVELAVMAADAVEDAYAIGDAAEMAASSVEAAQAAAEANAAYAEGASGIAELSGENIDFFLDTIEEFGDGDPEFISDHISMISEESDEIEEASHSAQSSYLAAEQNLDAAEAAEEAGTMTAEELEVVEDAVQEAADEAAETTSEAADANAAEAKANNNLANEIKDEFDECGCGGGAAFYLQPDSPTSSEQLLAWVSTLRKIREAAVMGVSRILGITAVVSTYGTCEGYLADAEDAMSESSDAVIEMEDNVEELEQIASGNPSLTTQRELQEAESQAARTLVDQGDATARWPDYADWGLDSPKNYYTRAISYVTDSTQSGLNTVVESQTAIFDIANENLVGIENYERMMSITDYYSQMWDAYNDAEDLIAMADQFISNFTETATTPEDFDFLTNISNLMDQASANLNAMTPFLVDDGATLTSVSNVLESAMDAADVAEDMDGFLNAASYNIVVTDMINASDVGTTTIDSLAADLTTALQGSANLDVTMLENGEVGADLAEALFDSANEGLNTDVIGSSTPPTQEAPGIL